MSEQNKAQVRRVLEEVYNQGRLEVVDDVASSNLIIHARSHDVHGRAGARQYVTTLREGFPDIHFTVEDQIAEGDKVVTRWTARGTHKGDFQGIPASGKAVRIAGAEIDRLIDGKVVECWNHIDELGLMQQLGVVAPA